MYSNPILSGFYPDPSICRVEDDFYLVCSSFAWFPCLPVFHSRDLVNWRLAGHVFDDPTRVNLDHLGVSKGFFAPTIRYHQDLFYLTCTLVDGGGNFVVTASDPAGPWSNPVWLPGIRGIDPSLFFDEGQAWIIYNSEAPDNRPLYNGHRTIRIQSFDADTCQAMGDERILVNGGTSLDAKPRWIEGPHLLKHEGWYYLIAAEGGTGYDHAVVAFRSNNPCGPFVSYHGNPVLTRRNLQDNDYYPITSTGHADLVDTAPGNWHAVFLGCRPYRGDAYNTGRETFLVPLEWKDGWPVLNPGKENVEYYYPDPLPSHKECYDLPRSGNFSYRDDFNDKTLSGDWISLRTATEPWYDLEKRKGWLTLQAGTASCSGNGHPSLVARRQQHIFSKVSTLIEFHPVSGKDKAGLLVFQNEDHFYFICCSVLENRKSVALYRSLLIPRDPARMELIASGFLEDDHPIEFTVESDQEGYRFYYGSPGLLPRQLGPMLDADFLSTAGAGGFVGCCYALYAVSSGEAPCDPACFDWFSYEGKDPVYDNDETARIAG